MLDIFFWKDTGVRLKENKVDCNKKTLQIPKPNPWQGMFDLFWDLLWEKDKS